MLFSALVILIFLILSFLYATAKLSVSLENTPYLKVFYVLMFITFLTVLEVIFCIYMYLKFRTKDGEEGPRGYHGHPGDKGDPGKCNQYGCRGDSMRIMIQKLFEKKLNRKLKPTEKQNLMKNKIIFNSEINPLIIPGNLTLNQIDINDLRKLHRRLQKDIELDYFQIEDKTPADFKTYLANYFIIQE